MKVLHIVSGLPKSSGVTTFVLNVVRELRAQGHIADVMTRDDHSHLSCDHYDIVHAHGIWSPWVNAQVKARYRQGVAIVWSTHGMTAPWSLKHKWLKKCLYWVIVQKPLLKRASLIHSTAERELEWNKELGFKNHVIVPLGTHLPQKERVRVPPQGYRKTLLFVGRVYPVKAIDCLIRAMGMADDDDWRLRVVGPDQAGCMGELQSLCSKIGVACSTPESPVDGALVEFVGPKFDKELEAEYLNCDCLALVSHTENFGATVVDAMAYGKPVMTSTGTPWKDVATRECGWWVDNDPMSLLNAIREMMSLSDSERVAMGQRGRNLVDEKYTWRAVAEQLALAYNDVLTNVN